MKNKLVALALALVLALSASPAYALSNFNIYDYFNFINPSADPMAEPSQTPATVPATSASYEERVAQLVNVEREKNGLPALLFNKKISDVARVKSKDMADNNYFSHNSPTYGMAGDMLLKFGVTWSAWGENIASGQKTPEEVVTAWMNSPGHRANILSPDFIYIGVGYCTDSNGKTYWTQLFTGDDK